MSTQDKLPPHPVDPALEPRNEHRTHHPHEHELLARLAQDLSEDYPRHASPPQVPLAPQEAWVEEAEPAPGYSPDELERLEREIAGEHRRLRRPLQPEHLPPPPPRIRANEQAGESVSGLLFRLVAVALVASLLALILLGKVSLPTGWRESITEPLRRVVALVMGTPQPSARPENAFGADLPKLVVTGADAGAGDEIGLGVKLQGTATGALVYVSGLATGTTLSAGRAWGETGWIIDVADVGKAALRPPRGFVGMMQYTLTLRLADGRSADRQTLQLQWDQAASGGNQGQRAAPRRLSADEIATLLKRGEELFKTGDLAGARLLLQRAAEAHDPVGALALATTFDPNVLAEMGVRGVAGNSALARAWYEKAREYGSREAPRRLELLASQGR